MGRRKISTTVYLTPAQDEQLKLLNQHTKVPVAEYIRQGIDIILAQHWSTLEKLQCPNPSTPQEPKSPSNSPEPKSNGSSTDTEPKTSG